MTPPETASEEDDGLLTASDVVALKLDADWVILSACNTAAPGAETGTEALSGLARAFFYAGARALLVSHWYVNSAVTVPLIARAFRELEARPNIGRGRGHAACHVVDHRRGRQESASGQLGAFHRGRRRRGGRRIVPLWRAEAGQLSHLAPLAAC